MISSRAQPQRVAAKYDRGLVFMRLKLLSGATAARGQQRRARPRCQLPEAPPAPPMAQLSPLAVVQAALAPAALSLALLLSPGAVPAARAAPSVSPPRCAARPRLAARSVPRAGLRRLHPPSTPPQPKSPSLPLRIRPAQKLADVAAGRYPALPRSGTVTLDDLEVCGGALCGGRGRGQGGAQSGGCLARAFPLMTQDLQQAS
jgi:hypothetical protein